MPEQRVRRDDLAACELVEGESPREVLAEGEAQMLVERFALSANNVTYAVMGDRLGYWRLFPAPARLGPYPGLGLRARRRFARGGACAAWSPWGGTSPSSLPHI